MYMKYTAAAIPDVLVFEPRVFGDSRGYFFESFRKDILQEHVGKVDFVQDNQSKSGYGVLRGLHFQKPPFTQSKLVRVIAGAVLDVAVDIREGSPWYGRHVAVKLDSERNNMLWIPQGFAHGFIVLSKEAIFSYKCDNYYAPDYDAGIRWNDKALGIDWTLPEEDIQVSDKDASLPFLKEAYHFSYDDFRQEKVYPRNGGND
uniref:dTDP-4-dehydrorhamnose 3,5-epimerase n=1 Tax=Chlorobium phaeobacteroides (strain BS1) TaxID=331678 RepID=B3ELW8_CHLPB